MSKERTLISLALGRLGYVARCQADYDRATALYTKSLALLEELGDKWHIASTYRHLAYVALHRGDYMRASAFFARGLSLCRELADRWITEECLDGLAVAACAERHYEKAARLFAVAETLHGILHSHRPAAYQAYLDQSIACARVSIGEKTFAFAWAEGRAMTLEQAIEYALAGEAG